ncbi:alpha/beta fold hydrolase [Streptomyces sp. NPDC057638]|uniref:alpha/beta fold hydrolase n=1 Tax=Streptomyces sp. NPDC057638 TaxID=3346190 RepID=UPI00369E4A0E
MTSARPAVARRRAAWSGMPAVTAALALAGTLTGLAVAPATADGTQPPRPERPATATATTTTAATTTAATAKPAPGTLLKAVALGREHRPHGGPGQLLSYASTGARGGPVTVTGLFYAPAGKAPRGGWPVISLTHGTVGTADACAPSRTDPGLPHDPFVRGWLDRGVAVVATDYEGLGTRGPHPYLHARSAAHSSTDIVRAARQAHRGVSGTWVVMGQSQGGHAAISTAVHATRYAPELDFRGAVATAPPTEFTRLIAHRPDPADSRGAERAMRIALYPLVMRGLTAADPALDFTRLFSEKARTLLPTARNKCFEDLFAQVRREGLHDGNVWKKRPETDRALMAAARKHINTPVVRLDRPLFIGQGAKDEIVQAHVTARYAQRLAAQGSKVTYREYPDADHVSVVPASDPEVIRWTTQRLARR